MADANRICSACGDGGAKAMPELNGRVLCQECYDELANGKLPKVAVHHGQGTGNMEPHKHDAAYHGDRWESAEW